METQKQVTQLGKSIGAKIRTNEYLGKSELKKILNKKGDKMFPKD